MALGQFSVTNDMLIELLHLPPGTSITWAYIPAGEGRLRIVVDHPDIPQSPIQHATTPVDPLYRKNHKTTQPTIEFIEWKVGK